MKVTNTLTPQQVMQIVDEQHAEVLNTLYSVIDPEIGVNIVDLGLVYEVEVEDSVARVVMTMTTPACPLSSYFESEISRAVLQAVPELAEAHVVLTFSPPWDPAMMSRAAKEALGW